MKKFFRQKIYNLLLVLSNRFPHCRLIGWKMMVGTSLLLFSGSCSQPRQKPQSTEDPEQKPTNPSTQTLPDEDILCYEPSIETENSSKTETFLPSSPDILIVMDEVEPVIYNDPLSDDLVSCYIIVMPPEELPDENEIYTAVEHLPEFTQGNLKEYIQRQVVYPPDALEKQIEGRVIIQFIVEKEGSVSNPTILRSIYPSLDSAAIEIIQDLPKFTPGIHNGDSVRVYYTVPVTFRMKPDSIPD